VGRLGSISVGGMAGEGVMSGIVSGACGGDDQSRDCRRDAYCLSQRYTYELQKICPWFNRHDGDQKVESQDFLSLKILIEVTEDNFELNDRILP